MGSPSQLITMFCYKHCFTAERTHYSHYIKMCRNIYITSNSNKLFSGCPDPFHVTFGIASTDPICPKHRATQKTFQYQAQIHTGFHRFTEIGQSLAWISSNYFESSLLPQLLRGANNSWSNRMKFRLVRFVITNIFLIKTKKLCKLKTRNEIIRRFAGLTIISNPWRIELANGWLNDLEIKKISRWRMPPDPSILKVD